jgi:hypothetical protein
VLGAALSGGAVAGFGPSISLAISSSSEASSVSNVNAPSVLPQRVVLSVARNNEIEEALQDIPAGVRPKIRADVFKGKYRLVWLTAWDWDTAPGEVGNTISILTDDYRRFVTLNEHRSRIALPEPQSGFLEMRGEVSEDDNIAISILSGTQPIALPRMSPGQSITIQIDARTPLAASANGKANPRAVPTVED